MRMTVLKHHYIQPFEHITVVSVLVTPYSMRTRAVKWHYLQEARAMSHVLVAVLPS